MKIIFAGTPEFAAAALDALHAAGHEIALVLTQPDRPSGRGLAADALRGEAARADARASGRAAADAERSGDGRDARARSAPTRWSSPRTASSCRRECSRSRAAAASTSTPRSCRAGAAPRRSSARCSPAIARPASASCRWTQGSTPVRCCCAKRCRSRRDDTAQTLHDRLAALGARLIVRALAEPLRARSRRTTRAATYAAKIDKREARIDWREPARDDRAQGARVQSGAGRGDELSAARAQDLARARSRPDIDGEPGTVSRRRRERHHRRCGDGRAQHHRAPARRRQARSPRRLFSRAARSKPGERLGELMVDAAATRRRSVVGNVLAGRSLDAELRALWSRDARSRAQDRAALQDICYGTLRFLGEIDAVLERAARQAAQGRAAAPAPARRALPARAYARGAARGRRSRGARVRRGSASRRAKGLVNAVLDM